MSIVRATVIAIAFAGAALSASWGTAAASDDGCPSGGVVARQGRVTLVDHDATLYGCERGLRRASPVATTAENPGPTSRAIGGEWVAAAWNAESHCSEVTLLAVNLRTGQRRHALSGSYSVPDVFAACTNLGRLPDALRVRSDGALFAIADTGAPGVEGVFAAARGGLRTLASGTDVSSSSLSLDGDVVRWLSGGRAEHARVPRLRRPVTKVTVHATHGALHTPTYLVIRSYQGHLVRRVFLRLRATRLDLHAGTYRVSSYQRHGRHGRRFNRCTTEVETGGGSRGLEVVPGAPKPACLGW